MKVIVQDKDIWDTPVTVQRFELTDPEGGIYKELVWCNHAEAVDREETQEYHSPDGTYTEITTNYLECDKCGAVKVLNYGLPETDVWVNAPEDGIYNE